VASTQTTNNQDIKFIGDIRACVALGLFPESKSQPNAGAINGWAPEFHAAATAQNINLAHYKAYTDWTATRFGMPFTAYLHDVWTKAGREWPKGRAVVRQLRKSQAAKLAPLSMQLALVFEEKPMAVGPMPPSEPEKVDYCQPGGFTAPAPPKRHIIGHFYKAIVPQEAHDNLVLTVLAQTMSEAVDKVRAEHGVDPNSVEVVKITGTVLF